MQIKCNANAVTLFNNQTFLIGTLGYFSNYTTRDISPWADLTQFYISTLLSLEARHTEPASCSGCYSAGKMTLFGQELKAGTYIFCPVRDGVDAIKNLENLGKASNLSNPLWPCQIF